MQELYEFLKDFIDPVYLGTLILLSYAYKNALTQVMKGKASPYPRIYITNTYAVFIIGIILGIVFYYLDSGSYPNKIIIRKLVTSYGIATSLYDLIIRWIIDRVTNLFSKK